MSVDPPVVRLETSVNKGMSSVTFCGRITSSSALLEVRWLKDGEPINILDKTNASARQQIGKHQELKISPVDKSYEGKYQLLAENIAGKGKSEPFVFKIENGIIF
jgi:hypothetical protein